MKNRLMATALTALLVPSMAGAAFIEGELGSVGNTKALMAFQVENVVESVLLDHYDGFNGDMQLRRVHTDADGNTHYRFTQQINGMEVVGSDVYMHVDARGAVYGINGSFSEGQLLPVKASLSAEDALVRGLSRAGIAPHKMNSAINLVYVMGDDGDAYLPAKSPALVQPGRPKSPDKPAVKGLWYWLILLLLLVLLVLWLL